MAGAFLKTLEELLDKWGVFGALFALALWAIGVLSRRIVTLYERSLRTDQIMIEILQGQQELLGSLRQITQQGRSFHRLSSKSSSGSSESHR